MNANVKLRTGSAEEAQLDARRLQLIRDRAAEWLEQDKTSALVLLAARNGVIALHEAWGSFTGESDGKALAVDAIFPVTSVTKLLTATAIMMLVEEGKLGLNRPLRDYIPEVSGPGTDQITIHHLLTHTSGFNEEELDDFALSNPLPDGDQLKKNDWIHWYLRSRYAAGTSHPPGSQNMYCNYNFYLLGEIIERTSSQSYVSFVQDRLFDPLNVSDSSMTIQANKKNLIVRRPATYPFSGDPRYVNLNSSSFWNLPDPNAGWLTSAWDLATLYQMVLNKGTYNSQRILSPASVQAMTSNQIPGISSQLPFAKLREASWGYGFMVQAQQRVIQTGNLQPDGCFYHSGAGTVFTWADPESSLIGILMSTLSDFDEEMGEPRNVLSDEYQNMLSAAVI